MIVDGEEIVTTPHFMRTPAQGIRMMAPAGKVCEIPVQNVKAAEAEGFRVLTHNILEAMHNRLFLAQKFFEEKHPRITNWRLPRGKGRW